MHVPFFKAPQDSPSYPRAFLVMLQVGGVRDQEALQEKSLSFVYCSGKATTFHKCSTKMEAQSTG